MWRFLILATLGIVIGFRARSERGVLLMSLLFGLAYGAAEVVVNAMAVGRPSLGGLLFTLALGVVLAAPVYAIGEIWRRTQTRVMGLLRRLLRLR
jgi:hypothetical protein